MSFLAKRNNKAFSEKTRKEFQDTISPDETITFYSLFDSTCQPDRLFVLKEKDGGILSISLINFLRGILNLFKVRPTTKIIYFILANYYHFIYYLINDWIFYTNVKIIVAKINSIFSKIVSIQSELSARRIIINPSDQNLLQGLAHPHKRC